jgi:hypothetical protein
MVRSWLANWYEPSCGSWGSSPKPDSLCFPSELDAYGCGFCLSTISRLHFGQRWTCSQPFFGSAFCVSFMRSRLRQVIADRAPDNAVVRHCKPMDRCHNFFAKAQSKLPQSDLYCRGFKVVATSFKDDGAAFGGRPQDCEAFALKGFTLRGPEVPRSFRIRGVR